MVTLKSARKAPYLKQLTYISVLISVYAQLLTLDIGTYIGICAAADARVRAGVPADRKRRCRRNGRALSAPAPAGPS